jgi:photosystem II stability/assembly factor-like uncharacterized protein
VIARAVLLETSDVLTSGTLYRCLGVHFIDANTGWVTTGDYYNGRSILHTEDGGTTWVGQLNLGGIRLYGVRFVNPLQGFVCGDYGIVYRTRDGGHTWQGGTGTHGISTGFLGISVRDASTAVVVGYQGVILRTTDGGQTWTDVSY